MSYFSYYSGSDKLPEGAIKISPSSFSSFFDETHRWFRERVLGEEPEFQGNTMSTLGTVVHGLAEMYMRTGEVDAEPVEEYLATITDPDIDLAFVREQYKGMYDTLYRRFLSKHIGTPEPFLHEVILPGIVLAGSIDLLTDTEVVDYKTTRGRVPTTIPRKYWFQQMCYVWLARKKGLAINSFRLVYITVGDINRISPKTGKRLKDYPSDVRELRHDVTDDDMAIIDNAIKLAAESVQAFQKHPELRHLLAQDYRLKEDTPLNLFKKKEEPNYGC